MKELTVPATTDSIQTVTDFVNEELEKLGCSVRIQSQIDIAIDELFGNIARYAYRPGIGPATIRVDVEDEPLEVVLTFIDQGKPFDPLAAEDPDITLPAEMRRIGGLGVYLVKKTMDAIRYEYCNGQNILRIRKRL